jgi:hypothetical protein
MTDFFGRFSKFWVAAGGAIIQGIEAAYPSSAHWLPSVIAAITAILVYIVPNNQPVSSQGKGE